MAACTHIPVPSRPAKVYRDECCHCFCSQDDASGVDVCLTCFQAGCIDRGHSKAHHELTGHRVVLNVRRKERPKADKPIEKLAINRETDAERYETTSAARCYECGEIEIPDDLARIVLEALSSAQQEEVQAWEQELTSCEHVLCLEQLQGKEAPAKTCSDCQLDSNLWMCLVCGNVACGRQQFGGVGGNGHGVRHVDTTGHSVAVKLGSITPEGTADIYCYVCDEERIDPELASHLSHFGVDLGKTVKTELSLQELQLEQNLKWEFSLDEAGEPLSGPGLTGMRNLGNSCYLASVVQCLFTLPAFKERFGQAPRPVHDPAGDLDVQMRRIGDGLLSGRYESISPALLKSLIGKGHPEFGSMRQQDAFEFLLYLSSKIDKLDASPVDSFRFEAEQRTQCLGCKRVGYSTTTQDNVSVLVPPGDAGVSVEELLRIYTGEERVDYKCACGSFEGAIRSTRFLTFPDVLVLNPGRFELKNWVPVKLEVPVRANDFSLDTLRAKGRQPGEEPLPDSESNAVDEAALSQLQEMGFPRDKCIAALKHNPEVEGAMEWLFSGAGDGAEEDDPTLSLLMDMGFPKDRCEAALKYTTGFDAAMEWLVSGKEAPTAKPAGGSVPGPYTLQAMACHKGASVHAGHYVAFCRTKEGWTLFNDERVVRGIDVDQADRTAYLYFFLLTST
ncbi:ubiquitin C-terminal hydrolase Ubp14 [Savitreella phatthalungensis]